MSDEKQQQGTDDSDIELVFEVDEDKTNASETPAANEQPGDAELETLRAEVKRLTDISLRSRADLDNLRKRYDRERADYTKFALSEAVRELLPVADNFERAIAHAGDEGGEFRKGVELIYRQLLDVLQKFGVTPIDECPVAFNPHVHDAVARVEDDSVPNNTVIEILQKGYFLNDRLVRPAMVRVATGGPERASDDEIPYSS
ncbi:MAG: nucleotide exchange factor GrpE [Thermoanaerobaculia bacterium]